jgi:pyroglutamyl-peptidase
MSPPRLLLCGFEAFPEAPVNPSAAVVRALAASAWSPPGAQLDCLTLPVAWRGSVETILDRLAGDRFDGLLVVGVAVEAEAFRVETLGRNRAACARRDHAGELWPEAVIRADAPAALPATAPWALMLEALQQTGLPAHASDDAGDYLCNFTLYRLLAEAAAPATGFLHVPQARECDAAAAFDLADIDTAVRACAAAFAAHLAAVRDPDASRRTA